MPSVEQAVGSPKTQLDATLDAGVDFVSQLQRVTFTQYIRVVLPIDGFVFWVKASLLKPGFRFNQIAFNAQTPFNAAKTASAPAPSLVVSGSLHYSTDTVQEDTQSYGRNSVMFTSETEVQDLNETAPNMIYIGEIDGVKFAFGSRGSFYRQAGLFHYRGTAIYNTASALIIDNPNSLDTRNQVVSNSMPIWLSLQPPEPIITLPIIQHIPLYPAYLVPQNVPTPYGAVEIITGSTHSVPFSPTELPNGTRFSLTQEKVRITFYGLRNFNALDFVNYLEHYSLFTEAFGLASTPTVNDEKVPQVELGVILMKKTIEFDINYYQLRVLDAAQQYVRQATVFGELLENAEVGLVVWDDPRLTWDMPGLDWDSPFFHPLPE